MKKYTIYQIDSFTSVQFKGNPAGVVVNAEGLSESQMQLIARELNNSETAFLFPPDDDTCDGIIRYFTPTIEVPTCGHATIAAMHAKAMEENSDSCTIRMKTKIGVLPFEIIKTENSYKVIMTQGTIQISEPLSGDHQEKMLKYLGLSRNHLNQQCPIQIASTGHSKVMIGIKSKELLNNLTPDFAGLKELSKEIECNGYFVFTFDSDDKDILTHGRMFAPAIGINEDPVTGNANGPLGAYLVHNHIVKTNVKQFCFKGKQGEKIGRDGVIEVSVDIINSKPVLVRIMGEAVVIFKTRVELNKNSS